MRGYKMVAVLLAAALALVAFPACAGTQEAGSGIYVAFGDSVAAGFGLENFGSLPSEAQANKDSAKNYVNMFGEAIGCEVYNYAISGLDTTGLLRVLDGLADAENAEKLEKVKAAEVITLSMGGNNVLVPLQEYIAAKLPGGDASLGDTLTALMGLMADEQVMREIEQIFVTGVARFAGENGADGEFLQAIKKLREYNPDAKLIVQTNYNPFDGSDILPVSLCEAWEEMNAVIRANGQEGGLYIVADVAQAFAEQDDPIGLTHFLSQDHPGDAHPNEKGHRVIFLTVLQASGYTAAPAGIASSPAPGEIVKQTKVALACADGGEIRYTLDGSAPTQDSPAYTAPIVIEDDCTIKAAVFDGGEAVQSAEFTYTVRPAVLRRVENAGETRYIEGFGEEFQPDRAITRYETVAALANLYAAEEADLGTSLRDVAAEYVPTVAAFESAGIIDGFEDGTFRGGDGLTRAEFVKVLSSLEGLGAQEGAAAPFADCEGHWAEGYVSAFAQAGYLMGDGDGNFRPDDALTRAEFVTLVNRIVGVKAEAAAQRFRDVPPGHWAFGQIMAACI